MDVELKHSFNSPDTADDNESNRRNALCERVKELVDGKKAKRGGKNKQKLFVDRI